MRKSVTFIDQVISRIKNNRLSFRKEVAIYQGQAVPCLFDRALLLDLNSTDNRIEYGPNRIYIVEPSNDDARMPSRTSQWLGEIIVVDRSQSALD